MSTAWTIHIAHQRRSAPNFEAWQIRYVFYSRPSDFYPSFLSVESRRVEAEQRQGFLKWLYIQSSFLMTVRSRYVTLTAGSWIYLIDIVALTWWRSGVVRFTLVWKVLYPFGREGLGNASQPYWSEPAPVIIFQNPYWSRFNVSKTLTIVPK